MFLFSWNLKAQAFVHLLTLQCEGMKGSQDACAVLDVETGSFIVLTSFSQHIQQYFHFSKYY